MSHLIKAWTATDKLSIIWMSNLLDKINRDFFQAVAMSILSYGCTTRTQTKHIEKKLDRNDTRMLRVIKNKSWKQLFGHLTPISKTTPKRHVGHYWRSKDKILSDVLLWTPSHAGGSVSQPAIYNSSVRAQDVVWKTCRDRWMIGTDRERRVWEIRVLSATWW